MNKIFHYASKPFQSSIYSKKPDLMSQILCFAEAIPKEKSSVSSCKSLKLMLKNGLIKHVSSGSQTLMPLAERSKTKLCNLVDYMMHQINGQKVEFPTLIPESLMTKSGRWEMDIAIKFKDRHSANSCLAPTHEEVATFTMSQAHSSYKDLPLRIYQITPKFRDELNPKLGLLRSKEFLMKDMYTFDSTEENSRLTYKTVCDAYDEFFQLLELDAIKVKADNGDMKGESSHEFHLVSDVGEDEIFYCPKCKTGINKELQKNGGNDDICESCKIPMKKSKAIEVGHAFLLGTRYSDPFQAKFRSTENTLELFQMGCYGLGITRILAASIECKSDDNRIKWPLLLSPYYVSVIPPKKGSKEESVTPFAYDIANSLFKVSWLNSSVVIDDRTNLSIGQRREEASSLGIPYIVIVSKRAQEDIPLLEVIDVYNNQTSFFSHKNTLVYFREKVFMT